MATKFLPASLVLTALWATAAAAAPAVAPELADEQLPEARLEHIQVEGRSVRIDEKRQRGQTESIVVEPHNKKLRPYEVRPSRGDQEIQGQGARSRGLTNQSWEIFDF